jgi:glyoxylate reductase
VNRVLVTRQVPDGCLDPLEGVAEVVLRSEDVRYTKDELIEAVAGVEAVVCLITDRIDADVLAAGAGRLQVVANVAVGYDNIDVEAATAAGVLVCNTPGILDDTTADLAFALLLAASRLMSTAEADLRAGRWQSWEMGQYLGHDIHGRVLGLVGYGRIGQAVARRAAGFGMEVIHHTRTPTGETGWVGDLDELLGRADAISLHVPLTPATRHLIGRKQLAAMKPTAVLVNTARGPVVDEEALAEALEDGVIFAAGIDVYEAEPTVHPRLMAAPRAVLLPHIGSATVATRSAMARLAAESAARVLQGEVPPTAVNPEACG